MELGQPRSQGLFSFWSEGERKERDPWNEAEVVLALAWTRALLLCGTHSLI